MRVLDIDSLEVTFRGPDGEIRAVDGASLSVGHGRTTALVGESGSGKSVMAQAVMGLLPASATIEGGRIGFHDPATDLSADLAVLPPAGPGFRRLRGSRIGMVFQEPMSALSQMHTIGDQIGEAFRLHHNADRRAARDEVRHMLKRVGFPDPDGAVDRYPFELSGGLRQRAVIAMALICRPALLIADEPTTALDVTLQAQILNLLRDLQAEFGMAMLFITHDLGIVANLADDMAVLFRGRIMERGPARELLSGPRHPYLKRLMAAAPELGAARGTAGRGRTVRRPAGPSSGDAGAPSRGAARAGRQPILCARGLVKSFSARRGGPPSEPAVNGLDLDLYGGECLGLVGESGCGKSTTARLFMRAFSADLGSITIRDGKRYRDVPALRGHELKTYRRRVQYVFQDPFAALNPRMTVFDILREPLIIHHLGDADEQRARACELISLVGLETGHLGRYPHSFSGGQRQRIVIARALALQPEILLLDEPVSCLDMSVQGQVLDLLTELRRRLNLTYLFVSHDLAVIERMADRIAVMCRGRIIELAPSADLFARPRHPYTKALLSAVPRVAPSARLDLPSLTEGAASDPSTWPAPFGLEPGEPAALVEAEPGHFLGVAWRHRSAPPAACA